MLLFLPFGDSSRSKSLYHLLTHVLCFRKWHSMYILIYLPTYLPTPFQTIDETSISTRLHSWLSLSVEPEDIDVIKSYAWDLSTHLPIYLPYPTYLPICLPTKLPLKPAVCIISRVSCGRFSSPTYLIYLPSYLPTLACRPAVCIMVSISSGRLSCTTTKYIIPLGESKTCLLCR